MYRLNCENFIFPSWFKTYLILMFCVCFLHHLTHANCDRKSTEDFMQPADKQVVSL